MKLPRLKQVRESKLLTQKELAAKVGIGEISISRIERGGDARISTVRLLAEALGVEPTELMQS